MSKSEFLISRREMIAAGTATLLAGCATRNAAEPSAELPPGKSTFTMPGGKRRESQVITVHCYRPSTFTRRSRVLLVIPGAGRNGDDYRDSWTSIADTHGVLVASPSYPESGYNPAAYQMCGVIENLKIGTPLPQSTETSVYLRDEDVRFDVNPRRDEWLFNDFDRLFARLVRATGSSQRSYDMFGHSAGAQVLHRHALLWQGSRARRVIAANAGFYTLPDLSTPQPVGLAGLGLGEQALREAFKRDLTILLGEKDNHPDLGGSHLHTPMIDQQGTNRLARGRYFHAFGRERASGLHTDFRWTLAEVPGVGHDYRAMARAAAQHLYG